MQIRRIQRLHKQQQIKKRLGRCKNIGLLERDTGVELVSWRGTQFAGRLEEQITHARLCAHAGISQNTQHELCAGKMTISFGRGTC